MDLAVEWERITSTPSDIVGHVRYMSALAVSMNAQKVVELGVRWGTSTVAWLHGLEQTGGRLWSIDIDPAPDWLQHPAWSFYRGDDLSAGALDWIPSYDLDIVFVDTSHMFEQTTRELLTYAQFVRPGGVIVLHDTELEWSPFDRRHEHRYPVKQAVDWFQHDHPGTVVELRHGCNGMATVHIVHEGEHHVLG